METDDYTPEEMAAALEGRPLVIDGETWDLVVHIPGRLRVYRSGHALLIYRLP